MVYNNFCLYSKSYLISTISLAFIAFGLTNTYNDNIVR